MTSAATFGVAVLALAGASGCASQTELAERLRAAAVPGRMPAVVACWERTFERAGFRGRYVASVDFTVTEEGAFDDVAITSLVDRDSGEEVSVADDADDLRRCLGDALAETRLPELDFGRPLPVRGYRIAFDDASRQAREQASERVTHVLIGPRANRCRGLYGHEPPRELAVVQAQLEEAKTDARRAGRRDRDRLARALQRQYDVALELAERLRLEALEPSLSRQARERYETELSHARQTAEDLGATIGCEP